MNTNFLKRPNLKTSMLLLALLIGMTSTAEDIEGQVCRVTCKVPHKVAPRPILNRALWLCFQMQPLIILLPWDSIPLALDLPPSSPLATEPEVPIMADIPADEPAAPVDTGNAYVGAIGGGYVPRSSPLGAPEIDPGAGLTAVLLLGGALCVMTGRRRVK